MHLLSQPSTPEVPGVLLYPPPRLDWCCPSCWRPVGRGGSRSDIGAPAGRRAPDTRSALRCYWRSPATAPGTRDPDPAGPGVARAAPAFPAAAESETSPPPPATAARTGSRRGPCGGCCPREACPEPAPTTAAAPAAAAARATASAARLSRQDPSRALTAAPPTPARAGDRRGFRLPQTQAESRITRRACHGPAPRARRPAPLATESGSPPAGGARAGARTRGWASRSQPARCEWRRVAGAQRWHPAVDHRTEARPPCEHRRPPPEQLNLGGLGPRSPTALGLPCVVKVTAERRTRGNYEWVPWKRCLCRFFLFGVS